MPRSDYVERLRSKIGHEVLEVPSACALIFNEKGKLLLMRHSEGGHWSFPGGMVEPYESPTDAAVREAWEETGLEIRITGVAGVFGGPAYSGTYPNGDKISFVLIAFRAEAVGGSLAPDGVESSEVGFFTEQEIGNMLTSEIVEPVAKVAFTNASETYFQPPEWTSPIDA